jgi:hypothetical protein
MLIQIPMRLPSLANCRLHWRAMAKLKDGQKSFVALFLIKAGPLPPLPRKITLTRIGKSKLDDDNLAHAFKYVRDQIARAYGVDDGSNQYQWCYSQRKGKEYSIEILIGEQE